MSDRRNQLDDLVNINYSISKEHGFFEKPTGITTQLLLLGTEIDEALRSVDTECDVIIDDIRCDFLDAMQNLEDYRRIAETVEDDKTKVKDVDNFEEELADILIRMFSMIGWLQKGLDLNMDVVGRVFRKMRKNQQRPFKHNKNF